MNDNDTNADLLIHYLDNELDDATKAAVEKRLATEQELKDQLTSLQLAREAVKLFGLKQQVKQIASEHQRNQGTSATSTGGRMRSIGRWSLGVAAVLLLLIAGIGIYEYVTISNNKLYSQLYEPYELRSTRGSNPNDLVEAAYGSKKYHETIAEFELQSEHSTADYFYAGQAFLHDDHLREAINALEHALASSQSSHQFTDESEFYLALAYLKVKDLSQARPLFEKIHSSPDHLFHNKVTSLFMKRFFLLEKKYPDAK